MIILEFMETWAPFFYRRFFKPYYRPKGQKKQILGGKTYGKQESCICERPDGWEK